ncbi:hypothetical protein KC345_g33 [Hortaea werneckii]|nr:hypothetical protein KC345_g33 [Hortaea werneckii]
MLDLSHLIQAARQRRCAHAVLESLEPCLAFKMLLQVPNLNFVVCFCLTHLCIVLGSIRCGFRLSWSRGLFGKRILPAMRSLCQRKLWRAARISRRRWRRRCFFPRSNRSFDGFRGLFRLGLCRAGVAPAVGASSSLNSPSSLSSSSSSPSSPSSLPSSSPSPSPSPTCCCPSICSGCPSPPASACAFATSAEASSPLATCFTVEPSGLVKVTRFLPRPGPPFFLGGGLFRRGACTEGLRCSATMTPSSLAIPRPSTTAPGTAEIAWSSTSSVGSIVVRRTFVFLIGTTGAALISGPYIEGKPFLLFARNSNEGFTSSTAASSASARSSSISKASEETLRLLVPTLPLLARRSSCWVHGCNKLESRGIGGSPHLSSLPSAVSDTGGASKPSNTSLSALRPDRLLRPGGRYWSSDVIVTRGDGIRDMQASLPTTALRANRRW